MTYGWNAVGMTDVFVLPSAVADRHLRLAGAAALKVLLWFSRQGLGAFDAEACAAAIGLSVGDCRDAVQYWVQAGVLTTSEPSAQAVAPTTQAPEPTSTQTPNIDKAVAKLPIDRPVKPSIKDVLEVRKNSEEFAYLLTAAEMRFGRPLSHSDTQTLLYLYQTVALPAEVILLVIAYSVGQGNTKATMRYVERVALSWAEEGIVTVTLAEQLLCRLEQERETVGHVTKLLELTVPTTAGQRQMMCRWKQEWQMDDRLIVLAASINREKTGKLTPSYVHKILERWYAEGIDTEEKALEQMSGTAKRAAKAGTAPVKKSSLDMDEYAAAVKAFRPEYNG